MESTILKQGGTQFDETLKAPPGVPGGVYDPINWPKHYNQGGIQPIDFIESHKLSFCAGNVVKYVVRAPHKNGLEDLKKARWYLDRLIKEAERG